MHPRFQVFCQPTAIVLGLRLLLAVWLPGKAHFSPSDPAKLLQLSHGNTASAQDDLDTRIPSKVYRIKQKCQQTGSLAILQVCDKLLKK